MQNSTETNGLEACAEGDAQGLAGVIINEDQVKHHLAEVVRGTVEQALLEAEADALCGAGH